MYHIAAQLNSREEAKQVYLALDRALKAARFDAHISNLGLSNSYYVNFLHDGDEGSIPPAVKQSVLRVLGEGRICQLPEATIAVIQQRRAERRARGVSRFESHEPTGIDYHTPILRDALTHEELARFSPEITDEAPLEGPPPGSQVYPLQLKDLPQSLRAQAARAQAEAIHAAKERAKPFVVRYRDHIARIVATGEEFDWKLALYQELLKLMVPYLFMESAMRLHETVWEPAKRELRIPDRPLCIELVTPLEMPYGTIKAIQVYQLRADEARERLQRKHPKMGLEQLNVAMPEGSGDYYRVELIGADLWIVNSETYDAERKEWRYFSDHQCDACERNQAEEIVHPCDACKDRTAHWASWLRTALLMIDREYAVSPEPAPFPVQVMTYEEEILKKVGHGKNTREIKATAKREIEYRIISYDVSTPAPRRERPVQEERADEEKRATWLTLHGKDELIYRRIHFEDIERHYTQHPRLLARCEREGGSFQELDGDILREYHLETQPDGTVAVVSKIVPFTKYVPMLREKKPTIRKVIASAYEQPEN